MRKVLLILSLLGTHQSAVETGVPKSAGQILVSMRLHGREYQFSPAWVRAHPGDTVVFRSVSGFPHKVQFYRDSIPEGAAEVLLRMGLKYRTREEAGFGYMDGVGDLGGPFQIFKEFKLRFSANAPLGKYRYYCWPHHALGMVGVIELI